MHQGIQHPIHQVIIVDDSNEWNAHWLNETDVCEETQSAQVRLVRYSSADWDNPYKILTIGNAICDVAFRLYDTASGGEQIGIN
jgi:hypothetical protein